MKITEFRTLDIVNWETGDHIQIGMIRQHNIKIDFHMKIEPKDFFLMRLLSEIKAIKKREAHEHE